MSSPPVVYVVTVDSRKEGISSSIFGYTEATTPAQFFQDSIVNNPGVVCHQSKVAEWCGLDLKLYFSKYKKGLAQYHRETGPESAMMVMARDPYFLKDNNGIASWLTTDPTNGLPEWTVTGKAYVVLDDGKSPLSKGQVWGIQEMINCAMDIYDMDPASTREGCATLKRWATGYRAMTWVPRSGCGGIDIYSMRKVVAVAGAPPNAKDTKPKATAPVDADGDGDAKMKE